MSVEMLLKPEVDRPRDINDNDLDMKHKYYTDKLGERKTTLVIPEPKRLSPLATALTPEIRQDRKSPSTSPSIKSEVPVYHHLPWQSPYYPTLPSPYSFYPYRLPAFPFPPFPEHLPFPPFPDHVRPCSSFGAMFSPMPFPHALSSFHFPIRHDKVLGLERKTIDNEDLKSMKRSYDSLTTGTRASLPTKPEPPSPTRDPSGTTEKDKKVTMDTTEPTKYQCSSCQKIYSTFSGLSKHRQFHCSQDLKKEFTCKYCDKTYVSLGALKMHIRTHTLPCKCKICGKAFSRPWLLQGHIRTHTGEKPFSCVHCLRAFADRSNLRAHLQTHSDVKKYSCKTCSKTFSRMSLLLKHEESCAGLDI